MNRPATTTGRKPRRAFTLIELLTVIAIISLLMAIAIPSLVRARLQAKEVSMSATLRAIDNGIEQFNLDFNQYPDSTQAIEMTKLGPDGTLVQDAAKNDYGAQRVTQALLGWDMLGYVDPKTQTLPAGTAKTWYDIDTNTNKPYVQRKGLYVDPNTVKLLKASEVSSGANDNLVIIDNFGNNMPVLYYKATPTRHWIAEDDSTATDDDKRGIFTIEDNRQFTGVEGKVHFKWEDPATTALEQFMKSLLDKDTVPKSYSGTTPWANCPQARPYNRDKFVLWSAGADAIYGTDDDIHNFQKK